MLPDRLLGTVVFLLGAEAMMAQLLNLNEQGMALQGFDPVSFFLKNHKNGS